MSLESVTRIQSDFVYTDSQQLEFLRGFLAELRTYSVDAKTAGERLGENIAAKEFNEVSQDFKVKFPSEKDKIFIDEVDKAYVGAKIKSLKDKKVEQVGVLEIQRVAFASNSTENAQDAVVAALAKVKVLNVAINSTRPEIVLVAQLAEMSLAEWQKRVLAPIVKEIAERQQQLRVAEASNQPVAVQNRHRVDLNRLMRKKASTLGVLAEYDRREALTKRLERETTAKDLKAIREERDALDLLIGAAETAKQKGKTAVADDPSNAIYFHADAESKPPTSKNVVDRLNDEFKGVRPQYVVIVRNAQPQTGAVPAPSAPAPVVLEPAAVVPVEVTPMGLPIVNQPQRQTPLAPSVKVGDFEPPTAPPPPSKISTGSGTKIKKD